MRPAGWATKHDRSEAIIEKDIQSKSIRDAMAQAQWTVEKHLAFHPMSRVKRRA